MVNTHRCLHIPQYIEMWVSMLMWCWCDVDVQNVTVEKFSKDTWVLAWALGVGWFEWGRLMYVVYNKTGCIHQVVWLNYTTHHINCITTHHIDSITTHHINGITTHHINCIRCTMVRGKISCTKLIPAEPSCCAKSGIRNSRITTTITTTTSTTNHTKYLSFLVRYRSI